MSVRISQETFHGAVVENMKEFDMGKEEALADAIEQFKQQGVDLSNLDVSGGAITEDGTIVVRHPILACFIELQYCAIEGARGGCRGSQPTKSQEMRL